MDEDALRRLLRDQEGVVSWRQLRAVAGATNFDVERLRRRRELVRVHPRVYVGHTGPLSWRQRAWAAVLYAEPAALCLGSALPDPGEHAPIEVAIDGTRRLEARTGLRIHRVRDLEGKVRWNLSPPRLRPEEATLDLVDRAASELEVVAVLSRVIGGGASTAGRLRAALDDAADGRHAVRLRWHQVFGTPCRTAERVGRILRHRGWTGRASACGPTCVLARSPEDTRA